MSTATPPPLASSPLGLDALAERVRYLTKWFLFDALITLFCACGIVYLSSAWRQAGNEMQWGRLWHDWQSLEENRKSARDQLLSWGAFVPALLALPILSSGGESGRESIAQRAAQIVMQRVVMVACLVVAVGALLLIPSTRDKTDSNIAVYPTGSLALCIFTWLLCSALFACLNMPAGQRSLLLARAMDRRNKIASLPRGNTGINPMRIRASLRYARCFITPRALLAAASASLPTLVLVRAWAHGMTYLVIALLVTANLGLLASGTAITLQRRWRKSYDGRLSGVMNFILFLAPASLVALFLVTLPFSKCGLLGLTASCLWIVATLAFYVTVVKHRTAPYAYANNHLWARDLHFARQSVHFQTEQIRLEAPAASQNVTPGTSAGGTGNPMP